MDETYPFSKERDIWLHKSLAVLATRDFLCRYSRFHLVVGEFPATRYACVSCEAAVSFDKFTLRNACTALKSVDVLGKTHVQESFIRQKPNETMRESGSELPWL